MRKLLAIALVGCMVLAALPSVALAGDRHAIRNRWAGVGIGAAVVTLGGLLLSGFQAPVVAAQPPVVYSPPPVVYAPPPAVVYAPPRVVYAPPPAVVYAPPPVVVYRGWGPPGHWRHHRHWDDD
jgi:hypothetical protein